MKNNLLSSALTSSLYLAGIFALCLPIGSAFADDQNNGLRLSVTQQETTHNEPTLPLRASIDTGRENLKDITSEATQQSYALKAAQKQKEAATGEVYRSLSRLLPKIEGLASRDWVRNKNSFSRNTSARSFRGDSAGISLSLPLITGGRTLYGIRQAQSGERAARANFVATSFAIELEVSQAYLSVIRDHQIEDSLKRAQQALSLTLEATQARFQAGDASTTDIALAKSALLAMQTEFFNAKAQRQNSETALRSLIHRNPKTYLAKPDAPAPFSISLDRAHQLVLTHNPVLISAFHEAEAAKHNIGVAQSEALPKLSFSSKYTIDKEFQDNAKDRDSTEKEYRIGFNLQVPLMNVESLEAVKVSRSRAAARYYSALDTRTQILNQFDSDWNSFKIYGLKKKSLSGQVAALTQALDGMEHEYQAGLRPITDILTYRVNKVRAEITLAQTHFEGHFLHQRILLATGKARMMDSKSKRRPVLSVSINDFIVP